MRPQSTSRRSSSAAADATIPGILTTCRPSAPPIRTRKLPASPIMRPPASAPRVRISPPRMSRSCAPRIETALLRRQVLEQRSGLAHARLEHAQCAAGQCGDFRILDALAALEQDDGFLIVVQDSHGIGRVELAPVLLTQELYFARMLLV